MECTIHIAHILGQLGIQVKFFTAHKYYTKTWFRIVYDRNIRFHFILAEMQFQTDMKVPLAVRFLTLKFPQFLTKNIFKNHTMIHNYTDTYIKHSNMIIDHPSNFFVVCTTYNSWKYFSSKNKLWFSIMFSQNENICLIGRSYTKGPIIYFFNGRSLSRPKQSSFI